jgi:hypothetical protein
MCAGQRLVQENPGLSQTRSTGRPGGAGRIVETPASAHDVGVGHLEMLARMRGDETIARRLQLGRAIVEPGDPAGRVAATQARRPSPEWDSVVAVPAVVAALRCRHGSAEDRREVLDRRAGVGVSAAGAFESGLAVVGVR